MVKQKIENIFKKICSLLISISKFKYWEFLTCVFFGIYCFGVPSFNERRPHYLILYAIFVFVCICFFFSFLKNKKKKFSKESLLFLIFSLSAIPGTLLFSKQFSDLLSLFFMGVSFLIFYLMFLHIDSKRLLLSMFFGFLAFGMYFSIHYFKSFVHFDFINVRLGAYFGNQNVISFYFLFGGILSLHFLLFLDKKIRYLFLVAVLLFAVLGYSTGSRTFLIEFFSVLIISFLIKFWKRKIVIFIGMGSLIAIFVCLFTIPVFAPFSEKLISQFGTIFGISVGNKIDYSTIFRSIYMKYGFHLGLHNIIFGLGSFGFSVLSGVGTYTHSNYAEVLCNFGLLGFLLYYYHFYVLGKHGLRNKEYSFLIFAFLISNVLSGFMSVNYFQKYQSIMLPAIMCVAYLHAKKPIKGDLYYEVSI